MTAADGMKTFTATAENVRDFAMVIGEFKMLGTAVDGVDVNYYYIDDKSPETSLTAAADSIRTFGELFGKYPYDTYSASRNQFSARRNGISRLKHDIRFGGGRALYRGDRS